MQTQQPENPLFANLEDRIEAIERLGAIWARSGAFKCDRVEQGQAILSFCMASGITPLEYLATYHNLDGRPQKLALACLAELRMKGGKHKWLTESDDPEKAVLEVTYEGFTVKVEFTLEDARKQLLVKPGSNWVKAPSYMLRARCITTAIGMLAPEIVAGAEAAPDEAPLQTPKLTLDGGDQGSKDKDKDKDKHPNTQEEEEKALAKMGLAPATEPPKAEKEAQPSTKPEPEKTTSKKKSAKRKSISIPGPGEEGDDGETPIPPPATIEPEGTAAPPKGIEPEGVSMEPEEELNPDLVNEIGHACSGHFVATARWMVKEGWIPPAAHQINTEALAAKHLQVNLPKLSKARAKKLLSNKEAFIRAVTGEGE